MSRLSDLLSQLKSSQPEFARDLEREVEALQSRRAFGLNFERHVPEAVNLPGRPIRKGDKVRVLPPRNDVESAPDKRVWVVQSIDKAANTAKLLERQLVSSDTTPPELCSASLNDLVAVGEFSDPIYPGLVETGRVERGGEKPFHTIINAENYHALQALLLTHRGKIDCIYIDPPYNSRAKDWKYNNDYVDADDLYQHSKWLAMMERRLQLAGELLDPAGSVLIVSIDEKECLRLGLMLEQIFPNASIQMVTSVINPFGVARAGQFARVDEYLFFVAFGSAAPTQTEVQTLQVGATMSTGELEDVEMLAAGDQESSDDKTTYWFSFMRAGSNSLRSHSPGCFYPIFVSKNDGAIQSVGRALREGEGVDSIEVPPGLYAAWPINEAGEEAVWQASAEAATSLLASGYLRSGRLNKKIGRHSITYLREGTVQAIADGTLRFDAGQVVRVVLQNRTHVGKSTWNIRSHNATSNGTKLLGRFLPRRKFPYPKSLYAVEDALRFYLLNKPGARIVDFFSGSGTTAHAVMRLNRQDGGRRQCISVTNNEVKNEEQSALRGRGLRPGDAEWEQWGICDYITKPRVAAAITGKTPSGEPIKGDYKFTDEFPMAEGFEENAVFFTLTYESGLSVTQHRAFERIAPLLWLRAGAQGRRIDVIPPSGWDVAERYGVIDDLGAAGGFVHALANTPTAKQAFIVTEDDALFRDVARQLPKGCEPVQLYRAYLDNFENDAMRGTK
jgi:adenine-specific DNA-methyltransferase